MRIGLRKSYQILGRSLRGISKTLPWKTRSYRVWWYSLWSRPGMYVKKNPEVIKALKECSGILRRPQGKIASEIACERCKVRMYLFLVRSKVKSYQENFLSQDYLITFERAVISMRFSWNRALWDLFQIFLDFIKCDRILCDNGLIAVPSQVEKKKTRIETWSSW